MGNVALFHLICGIFIFWSVSLVKAEDTYKYFTWTATYGTLYPLGVPQQVVIYCFIRNFVLLTGIVDQEVEFLMSFELIGDPH